MKKALQPQIVPQPVRTVVAVQSLTPEFALWNSATRELKRVYGGNLCENSVYTDGVMPKLFRMAAEDESYHNELILSPLPATIDEVVLSENPECKLVILNAETLELPAVKPEKPGCKVITHPAVFDRPQPQKTAKILPLFPDYKPQPKTA